MNYKELKRNRNCRFYNEAKHCSILKANNCLNCKFFKDIKNVKEDILQKEYQRRLKDGSFKRYDIK